MAFCFHGGGFPHSELEPFVLVCARLMPSRPTPRWQWSIWTVCDYFWLQWLFQCIYYRPSFQIRFQCQCGIYCIYLLQLDKNIQHHLKSCVKSACLAQWRVGFYTNWNSLSIILNLCFPSKALHRVGTSKSYYHKFSRQNQWKLNDHSKSRQTKLDAHSINYNHPVKFIIVLFYLLYFFCVDIMVFFCI